MFPQVYCKRQYENIKDLDPYTNIVPETGNMPFMATTQKLQPSAAPFEPKKLLQQQLNEVIQEEEAEPNTEQIHNYIETADNQMLETQEQYGNMPVELSNDNTDNASLMPQMQAAQSCTKETLQTSYHPLQHIWTLWYLETDRSKTWEEMQNEISSVNSVEDFWRLYNHIKPASEIKAGCDYSLFKHGIRPMWEDEANRNGGRWVINLPRMLPTFELDNIWLDVLLCLIGETFEHTDQLCGAVVNVRNKNNKISVWTKDGQNAKAILEIGSRLRDLLHLAPHQLHYQLHKDTMCKTNGSVRSLYVL